MAYQDIVEFTLVVMVAFALIDQTMGVAASTYGGEKLFEKGTAVYRRSDSFYYNVCTTDKVTLPDTGQVVELCAGPAKNYTSPQAFAQSQADFFATAMLTLQTIRGLVESWFFAFTGLPHFLVLYLHWPAPIGWAVGIVIAWEFGNWIAQWISHRSLSLMRRR